MIASAFFPESHSFCAALSLDPDHSIALRQGGREHPLVVRVLSALPRHDIVSRNCDGFAPARSPQARLATGIRLVRIGGCVPS
jgi:hypothetical protein